MVVFLEVISTGKNNKQLDYCVSKNKKLTQTCFRLTEQAYVDSVLICLRYVNY